MRAYDTLITRGHQTFDKYYITTYTKQVADCLTRYTSTKRESNDCKIQLTISSKESGKERPKNPDAPHADHDDRCSVETIDSNQRSNSSNRVATIFPIYKNSLKSSCIPIIRLFFVDFVSSGGSLQVVSNGKWKAYVPLKLFEVSGRADMKNRNSIRTVNHIIIMISINSSLLRISWQIIAVSITCEKKQQFAFHNLLKSNKTELIKCDQQLRRFVLEENNAKALQREYFEKDKFTKLLCVEPFTRC
ncbi:hypothetical protein Bhyg_12938 [Pseudolycoriella hygida]|uniref:Uncharacterized protein n=1 Tax=Pseudolycoriella hygida TaxID=35572 RepID=A0A9Q0MZC7_9DIPT|nr:hypothetical protein Bhyg_12938 [Pseudolycoriella hygida]